MVKTEITQKLAAILAADVAGYTRLMGDDERATIATLNEYRAVFRTRIEANRGRVVDMAGDSVLTVFDSVTGAVEAALEAQGELPDRDESLAAARRMLFRVGVNLGDIHEQDDGSVYGDGVNVAARLEAAAEPGGLRSGVGRRSGRPAGRPARCQRGAGSDRGGAAGRRHALDRGGGHGRS